MHALCLGTFIFCQLTYFFNLLIINLSTTLFLILSFLATHHSWCRKTTLSHHHHGVTKSCHSTTNSVTVLFGYATTSGMTKSVS